MPIEGQIYPSLFSTSMKIKKISNFIFAIGLMSLLSSSVVGCKEDISSDEYAVAEKNTLMASLQQDPSRFSLISQILSEVKLGLLDNASTLSSVLSARGNYTVFAPTDSAVRAFVLEKTKGRTDSISALSDTQKKQIAYNCIIDCGDAAAYDLSEFPATGGTFNNSTLDDRSLSCIQKEDGDYYIQNTSRVLDGNTECSNGMLFVVESVIMPSYDNLNDLIFSAGNLHIFAALLDATGWGEEIKEHTDEENEYVQKYQDEVGETETFSSFSCKFPEHRYIRFTAFPETDDVYQQEWGIPAPQWNAETETLENKNEIIAAVEQKASEVMGITADEGNYTSEENALNRFVAYHIIKGGMPVNGLVVHHNEYGYDPGSDTKNPQSLNYSVNVWDYYTTMGKYRSLIKVTQVAEGEHDYYVNRISTYDNGFTGNYSELGHTEHTATNGLNCKLSATNIVTEDGEEVTYTNNGSTGYYYPLAGILCNSETTRTALGSERMRIDLSTILHEVLSNNYRIANGTVHYPTDYFENITQVSNSTKFYYLDGKWANGYLWKDYEGDEYLMSGIYDFVLKLPPVPQSGVYELRMGVSNNNYRSMVQVYLGENEYSTVPTELPIDQRVIVNQLPNTPWVTDESLNNDETACREADNNLRHEGYMKAPAYFLPNSMQKSSSIANSVRNYLVGGNYGPTLRYILKRQYFDRDKDYYLRFKCVLDNANTEFFLDYFEFCPQSIFNGADAEDIW